MRVFMTGATGFLGREVLVRLLASGHSVLVLTRPRPDETPAAAAARLGAMVERTAPGTPRAGLAVAHGDVTAPDLALAPEAERWLAEGPVQVLHGAAEVRFDLPWPVMEQQNVAGTRHVAALARRLLEAGRLTRLDHVSTSFVAGDRTDLVRESDLDRGQRPRNDYERSKLMAELLLKDERARGLPVTVHRPSIIVGDSRSGRASSFKVLYWPMKVYARGRWRTMFGRPSCTVDVVPVDFVADAVVYLLGRPDVQGRTFHLAAGPERQATIAELAVTVEAMFRRGRIRYLDPDLYMRWLRPVLRPILRALRPDVAESGAVFIPYLRSNPIFSVSEAEAALAPAGLRAPDVRDYFERIVRYAQDTDFGQRLLLSAPSSDR